MTKNILKIRTIKIIKKEIKNTEETFIFKDFKEMVDKLKGFPYRKEVIKEISYKTKGNFFKTFIIKDDGEETFLVKYNLIFDFSKKEEKVKENFKEIQEKRRIQKEKALKEAKEYLIELIKNTDEKEGAIERWGTHPLLDVFQKGKTIFLSKSGNLRGETSDFIHFNSITGKYYFCNSHNDIVDLDNLKESKNIKSLKPIFLYDMPRKQIRAVADFFDKKADLINANGYTIDELRTWLKETNFEDVAFFNRLFLKAAR